MWHTRLDKAALENLESCIHKLLMLQKLCVVPRSKSKNKKLISIFLCLGIQRTASLQDKEWMYEVRFQGQQKKEYLVHTNRYTMLIVYKHIVHMAGGCLQFVTTKWISKLIQWWVNIIWYVEISFKTRQKKLNNKKHFKILQTIVLTDWANPLIDVTRSR